MSHSLQIAALLLAYGTVFAMGAWMALLPDRPQQRAARRMAAGDDRFLDEQQSLKAYARHREPRIVRLRGIALMVLAAGVGALQYLQL